LDESGTIVRVNTAWRKFGEQNGLSHSRAGVGMNYLDVCDSASGPHSEEASLVARSIREVIVGHRKAAWVEYPCHSPVEKRWFVLSITKFEDGDKICWHMKISLSVERHRKQYNGVRLSWHKLAIWHIWERGKLKLATTEI
jgi:hypothetical protein